MIAPLQNSLVPHPPDNSIPGTSPFVPHLRDSSFVPKVGLTLLLLALAAHAQSPKVKTAQGKVQGTLTSDAKIRVFRGIPYAAPPVGNLRWQAPQPPANFHGIFSATDYGNRCIQSNQFDDMVFHDSGASEDCLTLNVWAPVGAKKLPVMVWIYGGGFFAGSTSEARQNGEFLAHRNVVVISMNYRMGIFGFFAHPTLSAESAHHASGNYGLLDQAAAIAWVKQNASKFGGDASNITLFGESAGSFSVASQIASPLSKGSIARAIGESGAPFSAGTLPYPSLAQAEVADADFARTAFATEDLSALRKLSVADVLAASTSSSNHHPRFGPIVDGYFLPKSVADIYAAGEQAHIPVLAGWNADEGRGPVKAPVTVQNFAAEAKANYGDDAPAFLAAYTSTTDAEALQSAGDLAGDQFIAYSTWRWLEAEVETNHAPVYRYFFTLGSAGDKFHPVSAGAYHSDDIEYVFGAFNARETNWRPEDHKLSDQMQLYWTNFARTGDPNGPGLPEWPLYKPTDFSVMHLNADSKASPDTLRARYIFLENHPLKPAE